MRLLIRATTSFEVRLLGQTHRGERRLSRGIRNGQNAFSSVEFEWGQRLVGGLLQISKSNFDDARLQATACGQRHRYGYKRVSHNFLRSVNKRSEMRI